jgi:tetratricopeptide (TPR) repeat protein
MSEHRYRAYISYSHSDERWAEWLQRALETYRVPRRLLSDYADRGLPGRLAPVFRDREDLSSANNLSDSLLESLRCSEALIVVCSPAAAQSKWVNEEINQFKKLGRSERIFCLIVEGDPAVGSSLRTCFPAALFEEQNSASAEPLAADAREHADGKHLAKLKLVAALLGVRLDELRQRDRKRRRRWRVIGGMAGLAALALAVVTVHSVLSRQQERESAERMAAFVVELGEELQSDIDLDTLGRISTRAMDYLQRLDPASLTLETSIKVGLALRQLGHVSLGQGRFTEALDAYQRSLDLFGELADIHPDRQDVVFERAQAEFYVGDYYYWQRNLEQAWELWQRYLASSRTLLASDPANPKWLLEVSYGTMNLLLLRVESGEAADRELLEASDQAVDLARQAREALPGDAEALSHYSNTLAWAADAELLACNLSAALTYREENLSMALAASRANSASKHLRERLAYAHSGVAAMQFNLGELDQSELNRRASLEILAELAARDPTNELIADEIAANQVQLAILLMNTGRKERAAELMHLVRQQVEPLPPTELRTELELNDYIDFMLADADLAIRMGDEEQARTLLTGTLETLSIRFDAGQLTRKMRNQATFLRYLWFEINQLDLAAEHPSLKQAEPRIFGEYQPCHDADLAARVAVVETDAQRLRRQVAYLASKNYRNPGYMRFCERYRACSDRAPAQ